MMLALFCAALYVILPGAKSRYAIYTFPAFWPLLCCAWAARRLNKPAFLAWSGFVILDCLLLVQLMPASAKIWGAGWLGALALWGCSLILLWRWSRVCCRVKLVSEVRPGPPLPSARREVDS